VGFAAREEQRLGPRWVQRRSSGQRITAEDGDESPASICSSGGCWASRLKAVVFVASEHGFGQRSTVARQLSGTMSLAGFPAACAEYWRRRQWMIDAMAGLMGHGGGEWDQPATASWLGGAG
jgi:hypothetical protein